MTSNYRKPRWKEYCFFCADVLQTDPDNSEKLRGCSTKSCKHLSACVKFKISRDGDGREFCKEWCKRLRWSRDGRVEVDKGFKTSNHLKRSMLIQPRTGLQQLKEWDVRKPWWWFNVDYWTPTMDVEHMFRLVADSIIVPIRLSRILGAYGYNAKLNLADTPVAA